MGGTNDEQKSDDKKNDKEGDKEKSQEKSNTWSISSIFGWKKSKQAILPDDKNPSVSVNHSLSKPIFILHVTNTSPLPLLPSILSFFMLSY